METQSAVGTLDAHPVAKQHVEVDVEVERATEALDQGDRTGLGRLTGKSGLPDAASEIPVAMMGIDRVVDAARLRRDESGSTARRNLRHASVRHKRDPRDPDLLRQRHHFRHTLVACGTISTQV